MVRAIAVLLFAISMWAQTAAVRVERLKADVSALAAPSLRGRRTLDPGSAEAVAYVAAGFEKAGLTAPFHGSFLQNFEIIEYRPDPLDRHVAVWHGKTARDLTFGRDYVGSGYPEIEVTAPVVFAGYGITAPELGYDDYAGAGVRGKFVLVFEHEPQETDPKSIFNGVGNTMYSATAHKLRNAQSRGAVALLIVPEPNRKHLSNWDRLKKLPGGGAMSRQRQILAGEAVIPAYMLTDEAAALLLAGSGRKPGELQAELDRTLKPAPFEIPGTRFEASTRGQSRCLEQKLKFRKGTAANVIGLVEGRDPRLKDEMILVTSHWDHLGVRDGAVLPGADDNASGTAVVMELARVFQAARVQTKRTIAFVSFAAEETGLLGSFYYAAHPLGKTAAVLNLDMVGRAEPGLIGSNYSPEFRAVLQRAARENGLALNLDWERDSEQNVIARGDLLPFLLQHVPAVWMFNGFHPDYHQPTDTPEKLDYGRMAKLTRALFTAVRELADSERAPRFEARTR